MKKAPLVLMAVLIGLLSACGQKGALYLPNESQPMPEQREVATNTDDGNY